MASHNKFKVIYKEMPIDQISYLERDEFSPTGNENRFYNILKESITKNGIKDPVHIIYGGETYGDIFKVIVGNNRMVIAKDLGIEKVFVVIVNCKPDTFHIEGKVLNTDEEIKNCFYLPDEVQVRRDRETGIIDQIMPVVFHKVKHHYV